MHRVDGEAERGRQRAVDIVGAGDLDGVWIRAVVIAVRQRERIA